MVGATVNVAITLQYDVVWIEGNCPCYVVADRNAVRVLSYVSEILTALCCG